METEQFRIRTSGCWAAVLRQAPISGGVTAKISWAPFSMAVSMAASASPPGRTPLNTWVVTRSPMTASRYCRPRSWARAQSLCSGSWSLTKATLSRAGLPLKMRPRRPLSLGSGASVLTSMGSVRALISAHTALMLFASSTVEKDTSWSKS